MTEFNSEFVTMAADDEFRPILKRGLDAQNEVMRADAALRQAQADKMVTEGSREDERLQISAEHLALSKKWRAQALEHEAWVRAHVEETDAVLLALYERIAVALERLAP